MHATWPEELTEVFDNSVTVEYTSLTRKGAPICVPTTPYIGRDYSTLDVSTGLTYPAKAERARRNPKVCLLYADPIGSGLDSPPVIMVQGIAAVRDSDLQANTDRYVSLTLSKLPEAYRGKPRVALRLMPWYFARIWIEITPVKIYWWNGRSLVSQPQVYEVGDDIVLPVSDPAPQGHTPPPWIDPPASWESSADLVVKDMEGCLCDLSVIGADGFPACLPVERVERNPEGFTLVVGSGAGELLSSGDGPACLTFHAHPGKFTSQQNRTFVGRLADRLTSRSMPESLVVDSSAQAPSEGTSIDVLGHATTGSADVSAETLLQRSLHPTPISGRVPAPSPASAPVHSSLPDGAGGADASSGTSSGIRDSEVMVLSFQVDRALGDWSLAGNQLSMSVDFLRKGLKLRPRLRTELARRGQPVPKVRIRI